MGFGGVFCSQEQHSPTHAVFPITDLARPFVKHARIKIEQFCMNDLKHAMLDDTCRCTSPLEENPKDDADDDDGDEKKDASDGKDKHQSSLR